MRYSTIAAIQGGNQVDTQPNPAPSRRVHHGRKHIVFFIEAGGGQDHVLAFFTDNVDDVINGDAAQQVSVLVNDRGGYQVIVFKLYGHLPGSHVDRDGLC